MFPAAIRLFTGLRVHGQRTVHGQQPGGIRGLVLDGGHFLHHLIDDALVGQAVALGVCLAGGPVREQSGFGEGGKLGGGERTRLHHIRLHPGHEDAARLRPGLGYGLRGQLLVSGRAVGLFFQTGLLFFPQGYEGGHAPGVIVGGKLLVGQAVAGLHMARAIVPLECVEGLGFDAVQEQHFPVHRDDAVGRDDGDVCFHARPP